MCFKPNNRSNNCGMLQVKEKTTEKKSVKITSAKGKIAVTGKNTRQYRDNTVVKSVICCFDLKHSVEIKGLYVYTTKLLK